MCELKRYCVMIDSPTSSKLDKWASERSITRSAAVRMILNEFFLEDDKK
jgi:uncharacterized protein YdaU (DUF1376 family)